MSYDGGMTLPHFCDCPEEYAAQKIAESYKNGVVGLAGPSAVPLARLLIKNGNPVAAGKAAEESHVRLIVGGGDEKEILHARRLARDKRLILLPAVCTKGCYIQYKDSQILLSEPESVIYGMRDDRRQRAGAYAAMLGLLAECADAAVSCRGQERGYALLADKIKRLLDAPISFPVWAEFIARASEALRHPGKALYDGLAFCALPGADAAFFTNYLIAAALIQFTKYDFHGIFIGKQRGVSRTNADKKAPAARLRPDTAEALKEILPGAPKLKEYALRYLWEAGKKCFDAPSPARTAARIADEAGRAEGQSLLASLCEAGFLDGLQQR